MGARTWSGHQLCSLHLTETESEAHSRGPCSIAQARSEPFRQWCLPLIRSPCVAQSGKGASRHHLPSTWEFIIYPITTGQSHCFIPPPFLSLGPIRIIQRQGWEGQASASCWEISPMGLLCAFSV